MYCISERPRRDEKYEGSYYLILNCSDRWIFERWRYGLLYVENTPLLRQIHALEEIVRRALDFCRTSQANASPIPGVTARSRE
jgi:hypothetical protein